MAHLLSVHYILEAITELLLEHGAWPEARNRRNATPMMMVSHGGIADLLTKAIELSQERENNGFIELMQVTRQVVDSFRYQLLLLQYILCH